jgi:hypothetical protein
MMNRVTFGGVRHLDAAAVDHFVALFGGLTSIWKRIFEWATAEAGRLAASVDWGSGGETVPLPIWLNRFPSSGGASVDAFCRFVEYDLPTHPQLTPLIEARSEFLTGAE